MRLFYFSLLLLSIACFKAMSEQESISVMHGTEKVRAEIALGYDVNLADSFGYTPLMIASRWHRSEVVKILISEGADVNSINKNGSTALHKAAYSDDLEIVKLLVQANANVNSQNKLKISPIVIAAIHGRTDIVKYLINNGADVNQVNIYGETILHRILNAKEKLLNYKQIERILVENGAKDISSPVGNQISKEELLAILGVNSHVSTEVQTYQRNQAKSKCADRTKSLEYSKSESCNRLKNESETR